MNNGMTDSGAISIEFRADKLQDARKEWVSWVDVMGTRGSMSWSVKSTANYICKLHIVAIQARRMNLALYPVMDGIFATAESARDLKTFLELMYGALIHHFIKESKPHYRFMIRGAVAHGEVYHGRQFAKGLAPALASHPQHRDAILLGVPVIDAAATEEDAPPFGIAVHPSAREEFPVPSAEQPWWKWFSSQFDCAKLSTPLNSYFGYHRDQSKGDPGWRYASDAIDRHEAQAKAYFGLTGL